MKTKLLFCLLFFIAIFTQAQDNLIPNGSFEEWTSFDDNPIEWGRFASALWEKSADAQDGDASLLLQIDNDRSLAYIYTPKMAVEAGKTYTASIQYKALDAGVNKIEFNLVHTPNVWHESLIDNDFTDISTTEWKTATFEFDSQNTQNDVEAFIYIRGSGGNRVLIDNVSLVEKTTLSTNSFNLNEAFIYSNNGEITIKNAPLLDKVLIYSISGKLVKTYNKPSTNSFNISDVSRGVYLFKAELNGNSKIFKILR